MRKRDNFNGLMVILIILPALLAAGCAKDEADPACLEQCQETLDFCNNSCALDRQLCEDAGGSGCEAAYDNCVSSCENSYSVCKNSCERVAYSPNLTGPQYLESSTYNCEKMYYNR